ncbi:FAD binding domain protein [Truncatella angustata]|uniref:FAD binding domain protein n=1 Tax=Truncatella angustata TaxID=152316 RepID=A0A9P8UFQ7_9PEZI|nr:FAD binding domain protein [Truncatella angustata]KAH6649045.1 FAD binding domain protein [Truncatella angustata]
MEGNNTIASESFKAIIVGGGVAGLTLANMLEKFDIDYVLLEAHGDIAPAVGASIGMLPNGLRILDQIGCYERVLDLPRQPIEVSHARNSKGKSRFRVNNLSEHMERRLGYPILFFDRQWLLRLLYDNLKHNDRVLLNKKVIQVDHIDGGIQVTTKDGNIIRGSLVIGVDGVHSTIREHMKLIGDKLQPGYFPAGEDDRVPCYYRCSFGIAQKVEGYITGEQNNVQANGWSGLIISGPEDRVYWFIFQRLPEPRYGRDIPKYTKEHESQFITDKVTFGQIYSRRISSTLTPLHEIVYKKWFFKRIMLLGDAAHKPNPISGQGGNGAIESTAELVNAILRMKDARDSGLEALTDKEIEEIFDQTQSARHERERLLVADAHRLQALSAYENSTLSTLVWNIIGPIMGDELILSIWTNPMVGGARLEQLPIPWRKRIVPFTDELPAKPQTGAKTYMGQGGFVIGMSFLIWLAGKSLRLPMAELGFWKGDVIIARPWAGSGQSLLSKLVSFFSYPLTGSALAPKVQLVYFLCQLASPVLMYTIDGYRKGNRATLLALPSGFLGMMQLKGIGYIAPLHAVCRALQGTDSPIGRFVQPEVSEALLLALTLGYAIPTALMLAPGMDVSTRQDFTALWQFSPVLVSACTALFSTGLRWYRVQQRRRQLSFQTHVEGFEHYATEDMRPLETLYTHGIAIQAASHIATLTYAYFHPGISISKMLFGVPNPFSATWNLPDVANKIAVFLKYDFGIACCAWAASGIYSIWNLRRLGYIQTTDAFKASLGTLIGQILIGPGATWLSIAFWQDRILAGARRN